MTEGLARALDLAASLPTTIARRKIMREVVAALPERARSLPAARELHALTTGDRPG